jgi:hypothetical protein
MKRLHHLTHRASAPKVRCVALGGKRICVRDEQQMRAAVVLRCKGVDALLLQA